MAKEIDINPAGMKRLNEATEQALFETQTKINKLKLMQEDYVSLKERLITLPDKLSYKIMVPFGKLGFMNGQLINTNQVTILLGDNWFVKTSAKHASEIVEKRKARLETQINELLKQRKLLKPRQQYTSEYLHANNECVEIKEEYTHDEELKWREKHKENVRKSKLKQDSRNTPLMSNEQNNIGTTDAEASNETKLWKLLEELEEQENKHLEEIEKLEKISGSKKNYSSSLIDYNDLFTDKNATRIPYNENEEIKKEIGNNVKKSVKWQDELKIEVNENNNHADDDNTTDEDDVDGDITDDVDDDDEGCINDGITINEQKSRIVNFKHTKISTACNNVGDVIETPGDIYRLHSYKPRSILKKIISTKSEVGPIIEDYYGMQIEEKPQREKYDNVPTSLSKDVCLETVVEKNVVSNNIFMEANKSQDTDLHLESNNSTSSNDTIKISKFKANRLKKLKH